MELKSGTLLRNGEYRICEVLGQGGFGITYLGEQISLERKVAIKEFFMKELCNRDMDTSQISVGSHGSIDVVERFRQKFIKEARNIAKLKHRNIISIIDIFEDNGTAYYVMEYVEGGSLADKVSEGALPEDVAVRYIRQVASALALVHSKHMMHLDIKPANILVDEDDNAVLIDFGLSKRYDNEGHQTSTTPVGLSHGYAPMEQYRRGGVSSFSPATDIYSLGATLYKLVTGTRPPEADEVINDGLPDISYLSLPVRKAIETSMRFVIKERPQSVGEFLEVLDGNGSGTPLAASTVTDETVAPVVDESRVSAGAGRDKTVGDSSEETVNSAVDSVWNKKDKREKKDDNWLDDERFNDLKKSQKGNLNKILIISFSVFITLALVIMLPAMCSRDSVPDYEDSHDAYKETVIEDKTPETNVMVENNVLLSEENWQKHYEDSIALLEQQRAEMERMREIERENAISSARTALNACLIDNNVTFTYAFFFGNEDENLSNRDARVLAYMANCIKKTSNYSVQLKGYALNSERYGHLYSQSRVDKIAKVLDGKGVNVGEMISSGGMGDFRGAESPVVFVEIEGIASPLYVFFGKNSSSLNQKDRASLGEMASDASKSGYRLYVRGFSGTSGGVEMAKNRAKTVYDALRKYGADAVLPSEYAFVADDLTPALSDDCVIISFR